MSKPLVASMLVELQGSILLMNRVDSGLWCPPGGKEETGETILQAGIRELKEELDLTTNVQSCIPMTYCEIPQVVVFFFYVPIWNGIPKNMEPSKCRGFGWFQRWPKYLAPALDKQKAKIQVELQQLRHQYAFALKKLVVV